MRVFVYGTLREGDERAPCLAGARSLGIHSLPGFDLYDFGPYPGAVPGDGTLVGELHELGPDETLLVLDQVEGVHALPPLYRRVPVEVAGKVAWIYLWARGLEGGRRLESGDWRAR